MKGQKTPDVVTVKTALLLSQGFTQEQIARKLELNQSTVSRHKAQAERHGLLASRLPAFVSGQIDRELLHRAEAELPLGDMSNQLRSAFPRLQRACVVPSLTTKTDTASWNKRTEAFARLVAELFIERIKNHKVRSVGIVWGRTNRAIVDVIMQLQPRLKHVTFVALYGEPTWTKERGHQTSASTLVHDLAQATQASCVPMSPIPASIAKRFSRPEELNVLRRFFESMPNYQKARSYFDKLDAVICSVGAVKGTAWLNQEVREDFEGIPRGEWHKKVLGLFAGWFLPQPGYEQTVAEINERSLGAHLEHFQKCYTKSLALERGLPGVIVPAHGKGKAATLAHAIERQCVNEIVIDEDLASELLHISKHGRGIVPSRSA